MTVYIGIDGGGTQTSFTGFDENGVELATINLPTCHVAQVSPTEAQKILKDGVQGILGTLETSLLVNNVIISAGLAGYGVNQNYRKLIEENCRIAFEGFQYSIFNDAEIALMGALDGEDGILIIAGTGSIGYAKVNNSIHRVGGWGYMLGDEGSAYWIARKLLQIFTQQSDGRMAKTALYEALSKEFELDSDGEIVQYVAENLYNNRTATAKLAKFGAKLLSAADDAVMNLYFEAGYQLALIANALQKYFPDNAPIIKVSTIGGVWQSGEVVQTSFSQHLDEKLEYIQAKHSAPYGAYLLARNKTQLLRKK